MKTMRRPTTTDERVRRIARRVAELMSEWDGGPVAHDREIAKYVSRHRVELNELAARWDLAGSDDFEALEVLATAAAKGNFEWRPPADRSAVERSRLVPATSSEPLPDRFLTDEERAYGSQRVAELRRQLAEQRSRRAGSN